MLLKFIKRLFSFKKLKIYTYITRNNNNMSKDNKTIKKSYKTKLITDFFKYIPKEKKVFGYNPETEEWHCILCGISMGCNNPRQLCKKYYCENNI